MKMSLAALLVVFLLAPAPCLGNTETSSKSSLPPLMPRDREIALAENAGPEHIAREATIYVLERGGFTVARKGTNGFSCLVVRSQPNAQEPMCLDSEGTATILPRYLDEARFQEEGLSPEEVRRKIAEGFLTGEYRTPRRAGIAYMLSHENLVPADESGERIINYPPHVMFYAPNLTNKDIGANFKNRWLPFVILAGDPHAYIIVPVGGHDLRASATSSSTQETQPAEVMKTFLEAFHAFDFKTCRSLFALGAQISITRRLQGGEFARHSGSAFEWIDEVASSVKNVENFQVEFLESHTVMNVLGATVILRFRSTAITPRGNFTNNGTESANLIQEDGQWKIIQYNSFEDFRWEKQEKK